jgi:hypothetical protein
MSVSYITVDRDTETVCTIDKGKKKETGSERAINKL